jgi:3-oxoacyl-[acyl-carrier protein] reductase
MSVPAWEDRVLLVTGGSRGIGRAVVLEALVRGARVAFCSRSGEADPEIQASAARAGSDRVLAFRADVTQPPEVDRFFDVVVDRFGGLDGVACCAGITQESLFVSLSSAEWDAIMATNLTGSFLVAQRGVREFLRRGGGSFVFLGSLLQKGAPKGAAAYGASKAAVGGLARAIAAEFAGRGIRANQVLPGFVETDMTAHIPDYVRRAFQEFCPQRRLAGPREIAAVVLFLLSERAQGINGQLVHASGGFLEIGV